MDGKPLEGVDVRFWRQEPVHRQKEIHDWMRWGYDPCTGRFWALKTLGQNKRQRYLLDLLPQGLFQDVNLALSPRIRMTWPKDEDFVYRFTAAGQVKGTVRGLEAANMDYEASLHWELDEGRHPPAIQKTCQVGNLIQFAGLPAGRYRLEIRLRGAPGALVTRDHLVVEGGKVLALDPIDLTRKLTKIRLTVQDQGEDTVDAMVWHVRMRAQTPELLISMSSSRTDDKGVCTLLVPTTGVDLCVSAKGWGPQVFTQVHEDLKVKLQRPQRIQLRLVGLDKHPELLQDLQVRAQPVEGYPRWAWQAFENVARMMQRRPARRGKATPFSLPDTLTATSHLDGKQDPQMDIPFQGRWKFELAYSKRRQSLRLPLPALDSVDIHRGTRSVTIEVPISKLRNAKAQFAEQIRRR